MGKKKPMLQLALGRANSSPPLLPRLRAVPPDWCSGKARYPITEGRPGGGDPALASAPAALCRYQMQDPQ